MVSRPPANFSDYLSLWEALQSQSFPQLHSLPLFIGQFLPVVLQLCFSAAKAEVQIIAASIDIRIFVEVFMIDILGRRFD